MAALTANYIANGKEQPEARGMGGVSESDEFLAPSVFSALYMSCFPQRKMYENAYCVNY